MGNPEEKNVIQQLARDLFRDKLRDVVIDSRKCKVGSIFIALSGNHVHGNEFAESALKSGAKHVIVDKKVDYKKKRGVVAVNDPQRFLTRLGEAVRKLSQARFIAITGSNGKTTTKDLIALSLGTKKKIHKTFGNLNNHLGVPLTLCGVKDHHKYVVVECGSSEAGDINRLCKLVKPHVSVLTSISASHLQGLQSVNLVAEEKSHIFQHMSPGGFCLLSPQSLKYSSVKASLQQRRFATYGVDDGEFVAEKIKVKGNALNWSLQGVRFTLSSPAKHNLHNALAAVAVAQLEGISLKQVSQRLKRWKSSAHRMCLLQWKRRCLLDDSYNANPSSVISAVQTAAELKRRKQQKIFALLGDMKELGRRSKALHREVGQEMARSGVDILLTLGEEVKNISLGFDREGGVLSHHFSDHESMAEYVRTNSHPNDIILIKGSRSMKMERVVNSLVAS